MKITTFNTKHIDYEEIEIIDEKEIKNVKQILFVPLPITKQIAIEYRLRNKKYGILSWDEHLIPVNYHIEIKEDDPIDEKTLEELEKEEHKIRTESY